MIEALLIATTVTLKAGEAAPYDGHLLTKEFADKLIEEVEFKKRDIDHAVTATAAVYKVHLRNRDRKISNWKRATAEAEKKLEASESREFWAWIAAAAGASLAVGALLAQ